MSPHDCQAFRQQALESGLEAAGGVAAGACAACAAWLQQSREQFRERRQELAVGLITSLERLVAPTALRARVATDLEQAPAQDRLSRVLGALPRSAAPAALDVMVNDRLVSAATAEVFAGHEEDAQDTPDAPDTAVRQALRSLSPYRAPDVLARLVAEELEQGSKASARRTVRELERQAAPRSLARRLEATAALAAHGQHEPWRARAFAPLAAAGLALVGLAAAALILFQDASEDDARYSPTTAGVTGFEARLAADEWDAAASSAKGERALVARGIQVRRLDDLAAVGPAMQSLVAAFAGPFHDPAERPIAPVRPLRADEAPATQGMDSDGKRDSTLGDPSNRIQNSLRRDVGPTRSQG
ncbi:MAG: hypothetical protein WD226_01590 [Planctomycetota bacterium]